MILAGLAVVFVGIGGSDAAKVERQVGALLHHDTSATTAKVSAADQRALARHSGDTRAIVRRLHADGVVAGELVTRGGHTILRLAAYDRDGGLVDLLELPLAGPQLAKSDLAVLRTQLVPDLEGLASDGGDGDEGGNGDGDAVAPAPPRGRPAAPPARPRPAPKADATGDDENPLAARTHAAARGRDDVDRDAADDGDDRAAASDASASDADDGSASDGSASDGSASDGSASDGSASDGDGAEDASLDASSDDEDPTVHLRAGLSFGVVGRSFSAATALPSYSASGVGAIGFTAEIDPLPRMTLAVSTERTLGMETPMGGSAAETTVSRWGATASYAVTGGRVAVTPVLGLGRRSFEIASVDPARSPDNHYGYVVAGLGASVHLKPWLAIAAGGAIEPVVKGAQATAMTFGTARRIGLEAWGGIEARPLAHVFVRAGFDYQYFSWTWTAGALADGGASDSYPSGQLSVGAAY